MPDIEDQLRRYGQALDAAAMRSSVDTTIVPPSVDPARRRRPLLLAASMAAVLLVAAASAALILRESPDGSQVNTAADGDPPEARPVTAADLANRTFVVSSIKRNGVDQPLADPPPSLTFGSDTLEVRTGCNATEPGTYAVDKGRVILGIGGITLKGCSGLVGRQEHDMLELLNIATREGDKTLPTGWIVGNTVELRLRDLEVRAVARGTDALLAHDSDPNAVAACQDHVLPSEPPSDSPALVGDNGELRGAYSSSVAEIMTLLPTPQRPQFLEGRPDDELMSVCFIDGDIGASGPCCDVPPYNRGVFLVDDEAEVWLLMATHHDIDGVTDTPVRRPSGVGAATGTSVPGPRSIELGDDHLWRSPPSSVEDAARLFASEAFGWRYVTATITSGEGLAPTGVDVTDGRATVGMLLVPSPTHDGRWDVFQVGGNRGIGIDILPPDGDVHRFRFVPPTDRRVSSGWLLWRALDGTRRQAMQIDEIQQGAAEVSRPNRPGGLGGTILWLFVDDAGAVVDAIGGATSGAVNPAEGCCERDDAR